MRRTFALARAGRLGILKLKGGRLGIFVSRLGRLSSTHLGPGEGAGEGWCGRTPLMVSMGREQGDGLHDQARELETACARRDAGTHAV